MELFEEATKFHLEGNYSEAENIQAYEGVARRRAALGRDV